MKIPLLSLLFSAVLAVAPGKADETGVRELLALFRRYGVDLGQLVALDRKEFSAWFRPESVTSRTVRLAALQVAGSGWPVAEGRKRAGFALRGVDTPRRLELRCWRCQLGASLA